MKNMKYLIIGLLAVGMVSCDEDEVKKEIGVATSFESGSYSTECGDTEYSKRPVPLSQRSIFMFGTEGVVNKPVYRFVKNYTDRNCTEQEVITEVEVLGTFEEFSGEILGRNMSYFKYVDNSQNDTYMAFAIVDDKIYLSEPTTDDASTREQAAQVFADFAEDPQANADLVVERIDDYSVIELP